MSLTYSKVQDINSSTATVILSSTPQEATLSVGEEKEFDLNGDGYYDVLVKIELNRFNKQSLSKGEFHDTIYP